MHCSTTSWTDPGIPMLGVYAKKTIEDSLGEIASASPEIKLIRYGVVLEVTEI